MFTGIIEELCEVESIKTRGRSIRLGVKADKICSGLNIGDSVAVNGVCLTVVGIKSNIVFFDCIEETIRLTGLGNLKIKEAVNLERALKADSLLSGHLVLGHIDKQGRVLRRIDRDGQTTLYIEASCDVLDYLVVKGSISLDGVSLTVCDIGSNYFTVELIPHTLKATTLGLKKEGDRVNIEVDILAKYVKKFSSGDNKAKKDITLDFLKSHGFA